LRTHEFLPVERRGDDVLVVFADPLDKRALETARKIFGPTMHVGIAQRGAIEEGIARVESGRTRSTAQVAETVIVAAVNQFVRDAVLTLAGQTRIPPLPTLKATLRTPIKKGPGRTEFQRGVFAQEDAAVTVSATRAPASCRRWRRRTASSSWPETGNVAAGDQSNADVRGHGRASAIHWLRLTMVSLR
jgi:hypothetical protein